MPDRGAQQRGRREDGLHLGVLRVVDAAGEAGRAVGFEFADVLDGLGADARGRPARGERVQGPEGFGRARDDQAALGLQFEGVRAEFLARLVPEVTAEPGQLQFGAGLLVGEKDVALPRLVVPAPTGPRSRTVTSSPAAAAWNAHAAPTMPAPTTTTFMTAP